jgi:hypothetical protein
MSMQDYKRAQKFGRQRQADAKAAGRQGSKPTTGSVFGDSADDDSPKATQRGTTDDLPFATRDGLPKGQEPKGEPFNMNEENRAQQMPVPVHLPVPSDVTAQNREQIAMGPAQRVNSRSIPEGGLTPPATTIYGGTGSVGNASRPFAKLR